MKIKGRFAYIPVDAVANNDNNHNNNNNDTLNLLALMRRMYAQLDEEESASHGNLQLTCEKLFGVDIGRPAGAPAEAEAAAPAPDWDEYWRWEAGAVDRAKGLPLEFSEGVYNFASIQQFTRTGRRGLRIPQLEKRKKYAADCFSFLQYCQRELHEWAVRDGGWEKVWLAFLTTRTRREREARTKAIGNFLRYKNRRPGGMCNHLSLLILLYY